MIDQSFKFNCKLDLLKDILLIVFLDLQLVSDLEDSVFVRCQGRPSHIDGISDGRSRYTCLGKVGQEGCEDIAGKFGVSWRHGQVLSPDVGENVLKIIPMSNTHVHLFTLEIDNGVLASVLKDVFIGRDAMVGQYLGKAIGASGIHEVGEEVDVLGSELILVLEVNIDEVTLANLAGDGVEFGVVVGDDGEDAGQLVVDEVVVVVAVVEGVEGQAVEKGALVLSLAHDEGDLGELALEKEVLGGVGEDVTVDIGGEPTGEGKEHLK